MNKYAGTGRKRNQTLLVVEGEHEKNELFWLIFRCFPEMNIEMENVWIYGTNIYLLYEDIVREYGSDWADEEMDIDLPFVISKKRTPENLRYKDDFTNIIRREKFRCPCSREANIKIRWRKILLSKKCSTFLIEWMIC